MDGTWRVWGEWGAAAVIAFGIGGERRGAITLGD